MGEARTDSGFSVPPEGHIGDAFGNEFDDDYQVIRLRISWGFLSIIAFVGILALQIDTLGVSLPQMIGGTLVLAISGFVLGLIGLKFGRSRGAARAGVFLNGTVLGLFVLVAVGSVLMRQLR